jgi:uncharacterized membrane protein HdeD (DUF308 family)
VAPKEEATMSDQIPGNAPDGGPSPAMAAAGGETGTAVPAAGMEPVATGADPGMTDRAKDMLTQTAPWKRGVGWPVLAIEGLLGIGIGIYVLVDPDGARDIIRQILGAMLLINGLLRIVHGFRDNPKGLPSTPYRLVSGGIGATVGAIVLLENVSDYITVDAARVILALGLLAFGIIGLAAAVGTRESGGLRRGPLITAAIYLIFAVLLIYNVRRDSLNIEIFGIVFIILGVLFLGYAYLLYRGAKSGDVEASAAAV